MRLARLDGDFMCARALPVKYLVRDDPDYKSPDQFKRLATPFARRRQVSMRAYPEFGAMVSGDFLSHQVGKSFFRVIPELMAPRIHFCYYPTHSDTKIKTLAHLDLAHCHTDAWDKFYQNTKNAVPRDPIARKYHAIKLLKQSVKACTTS